MLYYFKDSRLAGSVMIHEILLVVIVLLRIAQQTDCGNLKAWQEAARQVSKRGGSLTYPTKNLGPILKRYLAWQASTSSLEHGFSKADLYQVTGRSPAAAESESRSVRLLLTALDAKQKDDLCRHAQIIYSQCAPASSLV